MLNGRTRIDSSRVVDLFEGDFMLRRDLVELMQIELGYGERRAYRLIETMIRKQVLILVGRKSLLVVGQRRLW